LGCLKLYNSEEIKSNVQMNVAFINTGYQLNSFEHVNHLGNVLATVSDRRTPISAGGTHIDYYEADVTTATLYYPYGMEMKSYQADSSGYRYGFNGQERDDEVAGTGNSYTAEFWQYDARIGRRFEIDPMTGFYPEQSPYACFNNNPIYYSDPLGLEGDPPKHGESRPTDDGNGGQCTEYYDCYVENSDGSTGAWVGYTPISPVKLVGNAYRQRISLEPVTATIGGQQIKIKKGGSAIQVQKKGSTAWLTIGVVDRKGRSFIWDEKNKWFVNSAGDEYNNPWYMDMLNAVQKSVEPVVGMAVDWETHGSPLYSIRQSYETSGVNGWGSFFAQALKSGVYEGWDDFKAGGHRRSQLLLTLWTGASASYTSGGGFTLGASGRVTRRTIRQALKNSGKKTIQDAVSLPAIRRYVKMAREGKLAPAIKVADDVIVDGNHRYIAGKVAKKIPDEVPSGIAPSQKSLAKPIQKIKVSKTDFGNH